MHHIVAGLKDWNQEVYGFINNYTYDKAGYTLLQNIIIYNTIIIIKKTK